MRKTLGPNIIWKTLMLVVLTSFIFANILVLDNGYVYGVEENDQSQNTEEKKKEEEEYKIPEPEKIDAIDEDAKKLKVLSPQAVTYNVDTKQVVYERDGDKKMYPASTTKILTAIVAIENGNLEDEIVVSHNAVYGIKSGSSHIALEEGEKITLEQALYGLLLSSANDCAMVIAEHIGGSVEGFAEMMNEKAEELGCENSHFVNPHGLYNKNHYTTAHDLAIIMAYCVQNDTFLKIDTTLKYVIPKTNKKKEKRELWHGHRMMENKYNYYEPVVCGKNGYVTESKFTLVTYGKKDDMNLIVVCGFCHSANEICKDTKKQMAYFFKNYQEVKLDAKEAGISEIEVDKKEVSVYTKGEINAMLPKGYEPSLISYDSSKKKNISLPLEKDQNVGNIDVYYGDEKLGTANIYAKDNVRKHSVLKIVGIVFILFVFLIVFFKAISNRKSRARRKRRNKRIYR